MKRLQTSALYQLDINKGAGGYKVCWMRRSWENASVHRKRIKIDQGGTCVNKQRNHKIYLQVIMISATFGGLLFGYDTGVINGYLPFCGKTCQLHLTPVTEGLVTSVLLLGAAFGALFCGKLADLYGRRRMNLNLSFLFLLASVGTAFAPNVSTMVVFRFLLGLAVGGAHRWSLPF